MSLVFWVNRYKGQKKGKKGKEKGKKKQIKKGQCAEISRLLKSKRGAV
jgi:hypothetical protein